MTNFSLSELIAVLEKTKIARNTDAGGGTSLLASNVPEDRILIPLTLIISDTSGGANSVDFSRSGENTDTLHGTFNLDPNETVVLTATELAIPLLRIEGGSNIDITSANAGGVDVTLIYILNEEV